jgi:dolichol-phosphate mannosyltransferase
MPELAVVIPTFNERENVLTMVESVTTALSGIDFEIIFVDDDSADGTADVVLTLSRTDQRIRLVRRIGRRGLSSAAVEGMLVSAAPYLALMDGDLQHDESILPEMLARLKRDDLDIVIGSRNSAAGSMGDLAGWRIGLSRFGCTLACLIAQFKISDPLSGYFIVTRRYLDEVVHSIT